jgi:hypothetical protein
MATSLDARLWETLCCLRGKTSGKDQAASKDAAKDDGKSEENSAD